MPPTTDMSDPLRAASEFVSGSELAEAVLDWAMAAVEELGSRQAGQWELRVARTQVTFARRRGFLVLSRPALIGRRCHPVALSFGIDRRVPSDRFAAVAHPTQSMWMHHLWLSAADGMAPLEGEAGEEVRAWLAEAWDDAAPRR